MKVINGPSPKMVYFSKLLTSDIQVLSPVVGGLSTPSRNKRT